jgi:hypothetical protein
VVRIDDVTQLKIDTVSICQFAGELQNILPVINGVRNKKQRPVVGAAGNKSCVIVGWHGCPHGDPARIAGSRVAVRWKGINQSTRSAVLPKNSADFRIAQAGVSPLLVEPVSTATGKHIRCMSPYSHEFRR